MDFIFGIYYYAGHQRFLIIQVEGDVKLMTTALLSDFKETRFICRSRTGWMERVEEKREVAMDPNILIFILL